MITKLIYKTALYLILCGFILVFVITCTKIEREPKVETGVVTDITINSAVATGNIIDVGDGIIDYGHCWSTATNTSINNFKTSFGTISRTGSYKSILQSLSPGIKYYIRAYVKNANGEFFYGGEASFSTTSIALPAITTESVTSITSTTATSGGNVTSDGGATVTARGVCWSTSANPTISLSTKTSNGTGRGSFTSNITGLTANTTYHVRAYATNSAGTSYGSDIAFTTLAIVPPTVATGTTTATSSTTATSGGNVTSDGGATVTARGVCWSTSANPTISLSTKTSNGTGTGSFTSNITELTANTTYHVRAYATNSAGTSYGSDIAFTTPLAIVPPTVATGTTTATSSTTATSGGNVTSDGGATVTARGVCWSTSENPTIINNKTLDGTGTGNFTSILPSLTPNTTYYVRAYATNTFGTGYGNQVNFITPETSGTFIDDRDGEIYDWISIGNQIWMAENLAYLPEVNPPDYVSNSVPYYYVYDYFGASINDAKETSNYNLYGVLYNWSAAVNNVCPTGWRLPSDNDWTQLINYLGGYDIAGGKLKTVGDELWGNFENYGATNESGFSAIGSGSKALDNITYARGYFSYHDHCSFWTTKTADLNENRALCTHIICISTRIDTYFIEKAWGYSIRCIKE